MSAHPSQQPDGSPLPARHRPPLSNLNHDTTESDLWALDDDLDDDMMAGSEVPPVKSVAAEVPAPRERRVTPVVTGDALGGSSVPPPAIGRIRMNVGKYPQRTRITSEASPTVTRTSEFDELEDWDDIPVASDESAARVTSRDALDATSSSAQIAVPAAPAAMAASVVAPAAAPAVPAAPAPTAAPAVAPPSTPVVAEREDDEFSPVVREDAKPMSLRPSLGLSKLEKLGVLMLLGLLVAVGVGVYLNTLHRLPSETVKVREADFPIKGVRLVVDAAKSYWRAPVESGSSTEVVRRGTVLLPVAELSVGSGSGAVRVVFRDESRRTVGDSITRAIEGRGVVKIAATAGFEDIGMYAAYRTAGDKPWTIEVLEGPSSDAPSADFKKLFEFNISTATR